MTAVDERPQPAPGQITIAEHAAECICKLHHTKIRVSGQPAHWICYLNAGGTIEVPAKLDFYADLKRPEYAPRVQRKGKMTDPYWCPEAPEVTDLVRHASFNWKREYDGPTLILDRSGAHPSSASSVEVAHGALTDAGVIQWDGSVGFWKVAYHEWTETGTPHPLGGAAVAGRRDGAVWVPHTRAKLLADLAVQGRWPDLEPMPAWTCKTKVRLDRWATHINTARCVAIDRHGRDSDQYKAVKEAFSQAIARLLGSKEPGQARTWKGDIRRTDWAMSIQDLSACTMWRQCDRLGGIARGAGKPEWAPVAIQHADELVIPADALDLFVTTKPAQGLKLRLDQTGKQLGTFKVK